jgi:soluble lytic murein transglycosylase-like protein
MKIINILNTFFLGVLVGVIVSVYAQNHFEIVRKLNNSTRFEFREIAWETARRYHIDAPLLFAIVQQESQWNPKAVSPKGAIGLMQIMPATAAEFCGLDKEQLFEPHHNLECGTAYFSKQLKEFGTVQLALCAYNAGPGRVQKLGRCPSFKETIEYTRNILANWRGEL